MAILWHPSPTKPALRETSSSSSSLSSSEDLSSRSSSRTNLLETQQQQQQKQRTSSSFFRFFFTTVCFTLALTFLYSHLGPLLGIYTHTPHHETFKVGIGIADITGPIGEINMMGYALPEQQANGIHLRLKARAFILAASSRLEKRLLYVVIDTQSVSNYVRQIALQSIQNKTCAFAPPTSDDNRNDNNDSGERPPTSSSTSCNNVYTEANFMLHATHTHSGPGGYPDDFLYHLTSLGIIKQVREALIEGIVEAVMMAHASFERSLLVLSSPQKQEDMYLTVHQVMVEEEVGVNRSPLAYDANPETERQAYHKSTGSTDRQMTLLKINGVQSGRLYASINWFPLHPISMNNKNAFVSGDNKGFASYLWELSENRDDVDEYDEIPIDESNSGYMKSSRFVAAFCQSNSGDVSPNIMGPRCSDTGEPCDGGRATSCDGDITKCMARGPGYTDGGDRQSTKIIGRRQYDAARRAAASRAVLNLTSTSPPFGQSSVLFGRGEKQPLIGSVDYRHVWVDLSDIPLNVNGKSVKTCKPAMGHSFAAGTTDGPGSPYAFQGANSSAGLSTLMNLIRDFIKPPSRQQIACHAPKQIFISTGELSDMPYRWQPTLVPLQIFTLGPGMAIVGVPGEMSTMAGRRLIQSVKEQLVGDRVLQDSAVVVLSCLTNSYSSYIVTYEEYQVQRYEGGSTIFGPHTLLAYQDQFSRLAQSFSDPSSAPRSAPDAPPPLSVENELSLLPAIVLDAPPLFKWFGDVIEQPTSSLVAIGETVTTTFVCAHPRNQIVGKPFVQVEKQVKRRRKVVVVGGKGSDNDDTTWVPILSDGQWDMQFLWSRKGAAESVCRVEWNVGETRGVTPGGVYRFKYRGRHKILNYIGDHEGASQPFTVFKL